MDAGDARAAFDRLLGELRPKLHRYSARMTGSVIDGEDVVQEALVKAIDAFGRLGPADNPEAWLFRIVAVVTSGSRNTRLQATRYALPGLDFHQPIAPASWRLPFAHPTARYAGLRHRRRRAGDFRQLDFQLAQFLAAGHHAGDGVAADFALGEAAQRAAAVEEQEAVADRVGVVDVVGDEDHAETVGAGACAT